MKKREIIISLMIIMVGIITLGVGWQKYKKASAIKPNLIKCVAHVDENLDMSCDKCGAVLSFKEIAQYKELQTKTEGGALIEIKGEMPQNTQMVASEISKEKTLEAAQKYISSIKEEDIVNGFNIALKSGSAKYQPQKYNQNVDVSIENINIEDTKNLSLLHIINQNEYEIINPQINEKRINFKATSFSSYILINVANHNVKFNNTENYAVYTEKGREITNGLTMIEGENYTFVVKPKDGYGIGEISATTGTLNTVGDVLGKTAIIDSVTADTEITVNTTNAPTITKQPSNQKGKIGDIITFEIEAENTLYYEWEYKKITDTNWASVSEWGIDSSTSSITIPIAEEVRDVEVRCVLENAEFRGANAVISNSANIIIAQGTLEDDFDVIDESNKMITEWEIPSGDTEIKLPVQGTGLNVTVDWGDGSAEQTVTTSFPTHTYATAGTYEIKVLGTCPEWGYFDGSTASSSSNYYTYVQYLTKVKQFGELSTRRYGFAYCIKLTEVSGESLVASKTFKNVTNMAYMFYNCSNLTILNLDNFETSKVTNMQWMFYCCKNLTQLNLNNFDTSNVETMWGMFEKCSMLTKLDLSSFDTSNVTMMANMFNGCSNLMNLSINNFDTSNVKTMANMFDGCSNLIDLSIDNFDTSNVKNMSKMFSGCSKLTTLDLNNFNATSVTDISYMFENCTNLNSLNMGNFNTANTTNMMSMFSSCRNLKSVDLSNFNTSKVTNMQWMFYYCKSLTQLNLDNFDMSNVITTMGMFEGCTGLFNLDISNFDTSKVTNMSHMFSNCSNLKSVQLSNKFEIPTSNNTNIFANTTNLKSIIIIDIEPLASQFTAVVSQLDDKTIYVPNKVAETAYEESWSGDFSGDRIQPILELAGKESVTIDVGETYTDAGYTVAGFTETDSGAYTCYGYSVSSSGEVNTAVAGKYKITYKVTRTYEKDGQTITTEPYEVTREIIVMALPLTKPTLIGSYTYNGLVQTAQLKTVNESRFEITNNTRKDAGTQEIIVSIKDKNTYAWEDGTTDDIKITWEIKPIIAEITWSATTIVYDGTQKQITATVSNTVNGEIVTVTAYDGTIRATDVGEYTAKVKSLSSTNYTLEGALNTEKKWYIQVAVVDMQVIMQDYSYGGTLASPSITNNTAGRNVAYYYSTEDASTGGTAWSTVANSLSIPVGTYYMYAIVEATQNYQETITDPVMFKVLATQLTLNMITEDGQSYQNEWTNQSVYITLTKNGDANVTAYQYKIGASGSWIDQVTLPIVLENTTNDEIKVRGVNPAGRVVTEEVSAGVVKIDKTNPTIANVTYKHENKILSVIFALSDGQSGISAYAITPRENMAKEWVTSEEGAKQVEVSGSGIYYIWAKDKVGNIAYKTIKVIKDIIPPTAKITVKEAYTVENNKYYVNQNTITISVDASDNQTPKAQIQMAIYKEADYKALTSEDDIVWEAYKLDNEWTVQKENAEEKVYVILKDLAGNITVKVGE